jgi:predicted transcriptional regulator
MRTRTTYVTKSDISVYKLLSKLALKQNPVKITINEILKRTGITNIMTVINTLKRLQRDGLVNKIYGKAICFGHSYQVKLGFKIVSKEIKVKYETFSKYKVRIWNKPK